MAAQRYEQKEAFFVKLFTDPDMLMQVMAPRGGVLYDRLRRAQWVPVGCQWE